MISCVGNYSWKIAVSLPKKNHKEYYMHIYIYIYIYIYIFKIRLRNRITKILLGSIR